MQAIICFQPPFFSGGEGYPARHRSFTSSNPFGLLIASLFLDFLRAGLFSIILWHTCVMDLLLIFHHLTQGTGNRMLVALDLVHCVCFEVSLIFRVVVKFQQAWTARSTHQPTWHHWNACCWQFSFEKKQQVWWSWSEIWAVFHSLSIAFGMIGIYLVHLSS